MNDRRRHAPATERNREPIAALLREVLPERGTVLEIASGTGEHAAFFAHRFSKLLWQPSDPDPGAVESIAAWREEAKVGNLLAPVTLDASAEDWPINSADAILCINMVHISPWSASIGLLRGAARLLAPGAPLIIYGPYRRAEVPTAPSNLAFDTSLRARNPDWGLRELQTVKTEAEGRGLGLDRLFEMPANNLTLIFRRT